MSETYFSVFLNFESNKNLTKSESVLGVYFYKNAFLARKLLLTTGSGPFGPTYVSCTIRFIYSKTFQKLIKRRTFRQNHFLAGHLIFNFRIKFFVLLKITINSSVIKIKTRWSKWTTSRCKYLNKLFFMIIIYK